MFLEAVREDLAHYVRLRSDIHEAQSRLADAIASPEQEAPASYDLGATAFIIGNVYLGAEKIFQRIAKDFDSNVPEGEAWHRRLLDQMKEPRKGSRPPVIQAKTADRLEPYLAFRHVQRNIYAFEFEWPRLVPLLLAAEDTLDAVAEDVTAFVEVVEELMREGEDS